MLTWAVAWLMVRNQNVNEPVLIALSMMGDVLIVLGSIALLTRGM